MAELKKLGRYELRRVLGKGAMGVVYEGFDPALGRQVAVKTILRSAALDEETERAYAARFMVEAKAVARLNHPHIVQVHDFGQQDEAAYLVMEFIQGRELRSFFDANERFDARETVRIMGELLDALHFAHSAGVIHRDVKPANVMLDAERRVKLADFGVARVQDSDRSAAGTMVGTPAFMSPEQIAGGKIDRRTDLFSAGVVLYQMLTGEQPFKGGGAWTVAKQIMQDDPPQPSSLVSNVSPAFDAIVDKALAKKPADRYADAKEFASALRAALGDAPEPLAPKAPAPRTQPAAPAARPSDPAEVAFWQSIQAGNDPSELEIYLRKFPNGTYADLARHKLERMGGTRAPDRDATVPVGRSPLAGEKPPAQKRKPVAIAGALLAAAAVAGVLLWQVRAPEQAPVAQVDEAKIRREAEERVRREFAEKAAAAEKLTAKQASAKAADQAAQDKAAAERAAAEKAAVEKAVAEKLAAARAAAEKAAAEKPAIDKAAAEKALAEKKASLERAAQERAAQEKAAAEKLAAEKAAAEKAALEKAAAERAAAEKAAAEKAAAEKAAAAKAAAKPGVPAAGDRWVYELRELTSPGGRRQVAFEARSVTAGAVTESARVDRAAPVELRHGPAPHVTSLDGSVVLFSPYMRAFREWQPGERWSEIRYDGLLDCTTNASWTCNLDARVVGRESVAVRAGSFDATRVEVTVRFRGPVSGTSAGGMIYGSAVLTYWFADSVNRYVKFSSRRNSTSWVYPDVDMELTSYTPAK